MRGAAGVAGEDAANYGNEVIPPPLSLSPTLLVFYVWYLQMVIHYVFLWKARDLVRDSIRKTSSKILWNCRQLWMYLHVWTTQEKHLSLVCMCFFSWHHRFKHVTNYQFVFYRMAFLCWHLYWWIMWMVACKFVISFLAWKCFHSYLKWKPNPGVRILVELNHANSKFINR
jgi:hypothetical protein